MALSLAVILFVALGVPSSALAGTDGGSSPPMMLPGQFNVSATGAATYTAPISVPPGTAGMVPALSLDYSNQNGDGTMGFGWTLSGLPSIGRCARTVAQDGIHGGVNYDANDRFCMNGQRLIVIVGTYGTNNSEYRTEIESFNKIIAHGTAGNGPAWFEVHTKSGQTLEFGNTADSQWLAVGKTTARAWGLNKVSDTKGNYFKVTYTDDTTNGQAYPTRIDYTGNTGLTPYNSVQFAYNTARPDVTPTYQAGSLQQTTVLLTNVKTFTGTTLVSDYRITYELGTTLRHSRITSIKLCDGAGVCLAPTAFGWQGSRDTLTMSSSAPPTSHSVAPIVGDFNGDGLIDVLMYLFPTYCPAGGEIYFGQQDGTFVPGNMTASYTYYAQDSNSPLTYNGPICPMNGDSLAADINGDGITDLTIKIPTYTYLPNFGYWVMHYATEILRNNGSGQLAQVGGIESYPLFLSGGWIPPDDYGHYLYIQGQADFNGDGRSDGFQMGSPTSYARLSNSDGTFTQDGGHANLYNSNGTLFAGDFDGDGCSDVRAPASNNVIVYFCQPATSQITVPDWTNDKVIQGDFNGDGKGDVLVTIPSANGQLWLSTGTSLVQSNFVVPSSWDNYAIIGGDWNGDGKTDIALISHTSGQPHLIFLSTGTGFTQVTTISNTSTAAVALVGDWNNKGGDDLWIWGSTEAIYSFAYVPELLTTISNGLGATTTITYDRLNKNGTFYVKGTGSAYPIADVDGPQYVTARVDTSDGIGGTYGWTYAYQAEKVDQSGRGSLGFAKQTVTDLETGIVQTTNFQQVFPFIGRVSSQTVKSGAITLSSVTNTYAATNLGGTRNFVFLTQSVVTRKDLDNSTFPTVTTAYTYDSFGNPLTINTTLPVGSATNITNTFTNDTTHWVIGQLTSTNVQKIVGTSNITRHYSFGRQASTGLLTQVVAEPSFPTLKLQADLTLDSFGNRTGVTTSGQGIVSRTSSTGYDTKGEFATSLTNALSQSASLAYSASFGAPTSQTDPNNLTVAWTYDTFGRHTLQTRPDGNKTGTAFFYCSGVNGGSTSCPTFGAYGVRVTPLASNGTTQNGPISWTYFDALNRVVAHDVQGFDSSWIRVATQYDGLGRVQKTSRPYFIGATQKWTTYSYDALGRVTRAVFPDNSDTTFALHGLSTSVTNDKNQTTTTLRNNQGLVATVTDAAGHNTTYVYDAFGNVTQVTDPAGNAVVSTYDARGRRITTSDPDLGNWTYVYDVLNEIISQTDAASQTTTVSYDKLGRVTQRVEADLTSTYVYDLASQGIGKLFSATGNNGYSRVQSYDAFSRPSQAFITVPGANGGQPYTIMDNYDANGRLSTITYPSGFAAQYNYSSLGYLSTLKDNNTGQVFWTANTLDAEMHVLQQTAGNGVATTESFNANTGRIQSVQAGAANIVANLSFGFDTIGNLTSRSDLNQSLSETFGYDNLNRLTSYQVNSDPAKTVSYDQLGNITAKSDTGTYSYPAAGQARPHGVSGISGVVNASYTYDANGNVTGDGSRTLTWTSYNMVASVGQGAAAITYVYDCEHSRIAQTTIAGTTVYLRDPGTGIAIEQFAGAGGPQWNEYLYVGGQIVAARFAFGDGSTIFRYFVADHLGSTVALTDELSQLSESDSYDAWGKRRNPNGSDATGAIASQTTRGFTGQEHIPSVGLINYNARVYDPTIGRFMSADSMVPNPLRGQNYNRYSYVMNNPLSLIDPTGHASESNSETPQSGSLIKCIGCGGYLAFGWDALAMASGGGVAPTWGGGTGGLVGTGGLGIGSGFWVDTSPPGYSYINAQGFETIVVFAPNWVWVPTGGGFQFAQWTPDTVPGFDKDLRDALEGFGVPANRSDLMYAYWRQTNVQAAYLSVLKFTNGQTDNTPSLKLQGTGAVSFYGGSLTFLDRNNDLSMDMAEYINPSGGQVFVNYGTYAYPNFSLGWQPYNPNSIMPPPPPLGQEPD